MPNEGRWMRYGFLKHRIYGILAGEAEVCSVKPIQNPIRSPSQFQIKTVKFST